MNKIRAGGMLVILVLASLAVGMNCKFNPNAGMCVGIVGACDDDDDGGANEWTYWASKAITVTSVPNDVDFEDCQDHGTLVDKITYTKVNHTDKTGNNNVWTELTLSHARLSQEHGWYWVKDESDYPLNIEFRADQESSHVEHLVEAWVYIYQNGEKDKVNLVYNGEWVNSKFTVNMTANEEVKLTFKVSTGFSQTSTISKIVLDEYIQLQSDKLGDD
jgi:hypothetical protein